MPLLPLFGPWHRDPSTQDVADSGSVPIFLKGTQTCFFQFLTPSRRIFNFCVWETTGRWDTGVSEPSLEHVLCFIPSSTVPACPHLAAALCLLLLGAEKSRVQCIIQHLPPVSQVINPGSWTNGDKEEPQPCLLPTLSCLRYFLTHIYTQNKSITNKKPNSYCIPAQTYSIFCWCCFLKCFLCWSFFDAF